eukprot:TRINITY_DN14879_c0_g1_i4.p1 TRINITY_DN14879_c0_g1~~TRINITY_DN14879_c0_g1_i4.p1  ORF type:complete len:129 (-),score=20.54 TRINITY_DN14879_c0_g1_i4:92-478(-)
MAKSEFDNVNSCKHAMPDNIMHATDGMIGNHSSTRNFKIVTMEQLSMKNNASVGNVSHFSDEVVMEHLENFAVTGTTSLQHPDFTLWYLRVCCSSWASAEQTSQTRTAHNRWQAWWQLKGHTQLRLMA